MVDSSTTDDRGIDDPGTVDRGADDAAQSERERIREQKLAELREQLATGALGDDTDAPETTDASGTAAGTSATPSAPIDVSGPDDFQRVVTEHDVVLVDCYADWCGPCQMMEPTIAALAAETEAAVAKVDVDANPGLAQQLGARSIPTLLLYVDGEPADRFVGAQDRRTLESAITAQTA